MDDIAELVPEMMEQEQSSVDVGSYPGAQYYSDLMRTTGGRADPDLANILVSESLPTMRWMRAKGVRWILAYGRQAFRSDKIARFWGGLIIEAVGGGKDLSDRLFELAEGAGADIMYEAQADRLHTDGEGRTVGVSVGRPGRVQEVEAGAVVLACGGFEASPEMRTKHLGPRWSDVKVRGTQFNTGDGIRMALARIHRRTPMDGVRTAEGGG